jgi:hypothetical protein
VASPLGTVAAYWRDIARHAFASAYEQLVPGSVDMTAGQFTEYEHSVGVTAVVFRGHALRSVSRTTASVAVDRLVTHDLRFGCQTWSGSYELRRAGGRWRIARAAIVRYGCGA